MRVFFERFDSSKSIQWEEIQMANLNIGIILGSTREGRLSPQVGEWVKSLGDKRGDANYEIVDIADLNLPFLGTTDNKNQELRLGMKN